MDGNLAAWIVHSAFNFSDLVVGRSKQTLTFPLERHIVVIWDT